MKRITGRRNLRCNHKLSDAYALESVVRHTVQATLSETLKHDWCKLAFMSIFVFNYEWISNFTRSKPIKISLKCMNETKKRLQKVFTLHYWRFFFLIQVFVFRYFVLLWYVYHLDFGGLEHQGGYRAGSGKPRSSRIRAQTVYEPACAYSTQVFVFVKETFAKSASFEDPAPRFVESVPIQKRILL